MDTRTAQIYDLLVDKGFDRDKVKEALPELVTKDELDVRIERGFDKMRVEMYRAFLIHGLVVVSAILGAARFL